jgi:hypothetical protein
MPEFICDVNTGTIDTTVVSHWKAYDISLIQRAKWETLRSDIDDKIRITAGTSDNYSLDKSVKLLE